MKNCFLFLLIAGSLGGCAPQESEFANTADTPSVEEPRRERTQAAHLVPTPPIPEALRGCWRLDDSEYPGEAATMTVTATELTIDGRVARPEFIESATPRSVYGRFSVAEGENLATVASSLRLDVEGVEPGTLVRQEGDAGSYHYRRCEG